MDANHINSFILSVDNVMSQFLGDKLERSRPFIRSTPFTANSIAVVVGFTGDLSGQVVYNFINGYSRHVVKAMCGMEYDECDSEIRMSAISELCNMISGGSLTHFEQLAGKKLNISPPTLMFGDKMEVYVKPPIICIPFLEGKERVFEINYSLF